MSESRVYEWTGGRRGVNADAGVIQSDKTSGISSNVDPVYLGGSRHGYQIDHYGPGSTAVPSRGDEFVFPGFIDGIAFSSYTG